MRTLFYTILLSSTIFLSIHLLHAIEEPKGAYDVRIPTYSAEGRINWELEAEEVDVNKDGTYSARYPRIFLLEDQKPSTIASSKTGIFKIDQGEAKGTNNLFVQGLGFEAVGKPWAFKENIEKGKNRLSFSKHGKIGFEGSFIAGLDFKDSVKDLVKNNRNVPRNSPASLDEPKLSKDFPTTAYGKKIVIDDLGGGKRRFLLKDDVFIKMKDTESNSSEVEFSTILCDSAEIFMGKDYNIKSRTDTFGRISQIHAVGNVRLNQPLRSSSANELKWSEENQQVILLGNANVSHQKWGEAQGEKIIISQKDGRAEVIGGSRGRSRLLLPALE